VLDLGSATELSDNLADGMFDILQGLMTRKDDLVVQGINTMGFIDPKGDKELLERTVRKYFEKLLNLNITDFGKIDYDAAAEKLADPDMKRDELRQIMKSIAYPEGWFYVERAAVIMFGLQATIAPKLNGIHVGFPYITQFLFERNAKRLAQAAASVKAEASNPAMRIPSETGLKPVSETSLKPVSETGLKAATEPGAKAEAQKADAPKGDGKEEALLN
jgi:predicted unusual protein kinase regulating ubiquinone biosynthesis (AarF/ABC1/UbiB family)